MAIVVTIEVSPTATSAPPVDSPYKGLANFTEEDAAFFFGREREREVIIANLRARRVAVLYGESGVGKTSLLRAGVVPELAALAHESLEHDGTPEFIPVIVSVWRDDPLIGVIEAIEASVRALVPDAVRLPRVAGLAEAVHVAAESSDAYLLVILDQFEEYFLYHADDTGSGTLTDELPRALAEPGLQASFLISIREDAVAKLDGFKARIPTLFDTFIRVEHLAPEAARAAILRPVDEYNARLAPYGQVSVEDPGLVDAVLAQVRTGQVVLEQAGQGTVQRRSTKVTADDRIETPYLQLVMARLWSEELQHGSRSLRLETLVALGGAQEIVRTHLDAALKNLSQTERYAVADLFHQLVTPSGTKIAHSAADLAEYVDLSEAQVTQLLEKLARPETRIVRAVAPPPGDPGPSRYEIFHDVLAPSILDWRGRQTASRRARAVFRRRILRLLAVLGATVIAVIVWLAISAVNARNQADAAAGRAHSAERMAEHVARMLRVTSHDATLLAARYNRQRIAEAGLKTRADREAAASARNAALARMLAVAATNQEVRANNLAAVNQAQASRETVLAVAARRSARSAAQNANSAQLNLYIARQSIALSQVKPQVATSLCQSRTCILFASTSLGNVPPNATTVVWVDGKRLYAQSPQVNRVHSIRVPSLSGGGTTYSPPGVCATPGAPPVPCGNGVTNDIGPREAFGVQTEFLVTLRDLGWLYVIETEKPHKITSSTGGGVTFYSATQASEIRLVTVGQCRTAGSRATSSDAPAICPLPPP